MVSTRMQLLQSSTCRTQNSSSSIQDWIRGVKAVQHHPFRQVKPDQHKTSSYVPEIV